jgi:hypothetical protein
MKDKNDSMKDHLHEALKEPMLILALSCIPCWPRLFAL